MISQRALALSRTDHKTTGISYAAHHAHTTRMSNLRQRSSDLESFERNTVRVFWGDPFEKMGGVLGEVSVFDWWEEALNKLNKELGAITVDARESSTGSDKKEVHATFVPKQHRVDDVK